MMTSHPTVQEYLGRLRGSLKDIPLARRREIIEEIEEHIREALSELGPRAGEAEVRNALERVGDPEDIATEARSRLGIKPARPRWSDTAAVILLPIGGVVLPVVGWLIGLVLLWSSEVWSTRDKLLGTLVIPGGLLPAFVLLFLPVSSWESCGVDSSGAGSCVSGPTPLWVLGAWTLLAILVIAPIAVAIHLARRIRRAGSAAG